MSDLFRAAAIMAAGCLAASVYAQPVRAIDDTDALTAAKSVAAAIQGAYNANKGADVAALFVKGGVWLTPGGTMLTDRNDMEKAVSARIKAGWTDQTLRVIEAHPEGDDVWYIQEYVIAGTGPVAGQSITGYTAQLITRDTTGWRLKFIAANIKPVQDVTGMAAATAKK